MPETIRIIGIGNPLMGDDGVGIVAVQRLAAMELPEGVEVIDGGTVGLTLLDLLEGAQQVLLIDAVEMGKAPGELEIMALDEIRLEDADAGGISLHQTGLAQVLALGRELGPLPEVTLFGIQPDSVARGLGLSPPLARAISPIVDRVGGWLRQFGKPF